MKRMDQKLIKVITRNIEQGQFKDIVQISHDCLTQKEALYFIIYCCRACNTYMNESSKFDVDDLIKAVKKLTKLIVAITESSEYDKYLQSMFFICKLISKKDFTLLLQMDSEILPSFMPKVLTEMQKNTYVALCNAITNEVLSIVESGLKPEKETLISIGFLITKILVTSCNCRTLLNFTSSYGTFLAKSLVELEQIYKYFLFNMDLINDFSIDDRCPDISSLITFGFYMYSAHLSQGMLKESQICFKTIYKAIPEIEEWLTLKKLLKICRNMLDLNQKDELKKYKVILASFKMNKMSEHFSTVCRIIVQATSAYSKFCKNFDPEKSFIVSSIHSGLFEVLYDLLEISIMYSKEVCRKQCICSRSKNLSQDLALTISNLCILLLKHTNVPEDFIVNLLTNFEKYCRFLIALKQRKCNLFNHNWTEFAHNFYNIGVQLLRIEKYEEALKIGTVILKTHEFVGELEDIIVSSTMNLLSSIYLKQKKYRESLIYATMEIIHTKKLSRSTVFCKWLKIKAEARENDEFVDLQEFSISTINDKIPGEFKYYIRHFVNDKKLQEDMLVEELEMYSLRWRSKIPMMAAFTNLCNIADNSTLVRVFMKIFSDIEHRIHNNVTRLLENVFKKFEKNVTDDKRIYLAFIYYFQYKTKTVELISKNVEEMKKIAEVSKPSSDIMEIMPSDAHDTCDVVSVYKGLKIGNTKMIKLEQSLCILEELTKTDISECNFGDIELEKLYILARHIGLEFELHSDTLKSVKAYTLASLLAELMKNDCFILESAASLFKYISDDKLEKKMQEVASALDDDQSHKYQIPYFLSLAHLHLSKRNVLIAHSYFKKAQKYWTNSRENKNPWYTGIAIDVLQFDLAWAGKTEKIEIGLTFSFGPLMKAYNAIVDKYNKDPEWCYEPMILLFTVMEALIKMYHDMKMTREVRCFGKQALRLAQEHIFPIRTAKVLNHLAFADLRGNHLDDARVKIDGISEILLLDRGKRKTGPPTLRKKSSSYDIVNEISAGLQEIMLDNPTSSSFNFKTSSSSPVYIMECFKVPLFFDHMNCDCIQCISTEYRKVVVSYFHLESLWYMQKKETTLADNFFKGSIEVYELLNEKTDEISKIYKAIMISDTLKNIEIEHRFACEEQNFHCIIDYIKFLYLFGALEMAKKMSETFIDKFSSLKNHYPNLFGELLVLRLGLIYQTKNVENLPDIEVSLSNCIFETPQKGGRAVDLPKLNSPKIKKVFPPKIIKFNLIDADLEMAKTPLKPQVNTPKNAALPPSIRNTKTPLFKTPATKIFQDDGVQKSKKTPKSKLVPPNLSSTILNQMPGDNRVPLVEINESSNEFLGEKSNTVSTECGVHLKNSIMEVTTEMLSAKLKNRRKNNPSPASCSSNNSSSKSKSSRKKLDLNKAFIENEPPKRVMRSMTRKKLDLNTTRL